MTQVLRHHGSHREDDGAVDWNALLLLLYRDFEYENAWKWTNQEWLDLLLKGSDKKRFQYCLNSDGLIPLHACHPRSLWRSQGGSYIAG